MGGKGRVENIVGGERNGREFEGQLTVEDCGYFNGGKIMVSVPEGKKSSTVKN